MAANVASTDYDVAIIGGGTGGYVAAIRAAQLGLRTALIEQGKLGGTCLHRGCIPTKALLESAEVLHLVQEAASFGVVPLQTPADPLQTLVDPTTSPGGGGPAVAAAAGEPTRQAPSPSLAAAVQSGSWGVDWQAVLSRQAAVVEQLYRGIQFLMKKNKITVIEGRGTFSGIGRITVQQHDGRLLEIAAGDIIIATGSRPKPLPGLVPDGERILTSDEALRLDHVPTSIAVVGAGAVGVEFASLFNDLGSQVTLIEFLPSVVPLEDEEIGKELARRLSRRGVKVLTAHGVDAASVQSSGRGLRFQALPRNGGDPLPLESEYLLLAVGRTGNVEDLGLEVVGITPERGVIPVDNYMRSSVDHVYAIGDVAGGLMLAHAAAKEGEVAVERIAGRETEPIDYSRMPRATYCRPQVASVGLSEAEARQAGHEVKTGKFFFKGNAKALILGESDGFVKVVIDGTDNEVLGVHIIGPQATDLIAEASLARSFEAVSWEIGATVHPHPTLSEAVREAALAASGRAIHA